MTKAEAIAMLKRIQEPEAWEPQLNQVAFEALDMAIEALSQESSEDVISRQAAIDALESGKDKTAKGDIGGFYNVIIQNDIDKLRDLPSAQPERKRGHWIEVDDSYNRISGRCSVCGWESHMYEDDVVGMDFCPHCGADLRGEEQKNGE